MKWITRERPKIDRIACPWLIARFIDADAEFLFVPPARVLAIAGEQGAIPFDVPDVELSHVGPLCSFDAILAKYGLSDDALAVLAPIVRGADTGRPDLAPEAPGLLAMSLGLSQCFADDHEMLAHGMVMYDALYAWAGRARSETHGWLAGTARAVAAEPHDVTVSELRTALSLGEVLLVDVRKRPAYETAGRRIAGAEWRDPFAVADWQAALPHDRPVVVYCVHGHEVSRNARDALVAGGRDARILIGGYEAWVEAGGATEPNPAG
jgi:rhodanese-related sulfurtransferase